MGSKMMVAGKVFVVTGAGSGMGRELTLELVNRGARVAGIDLREGALEETQRLAGKNVEIFLLDVTSTSAVSALLERVTKVFGKVDGLINNAGIIQPFVKVDQLSMNDLERVMAVNFTGPVLLIRAFLPILKAQPQAVILNVSSMGAYAPVPGQSIYGASKAAIAQLTDGLRSELMSTKVTVTTVYPGAINTNIAVNSGITMDLSNQSNPKIRMTDAKVAAREMIDAIESGKERVFIGVDSRTLNILNRLNPKWAAWLIYRNMRSLLGE